MKEYLPYITTIIAILGFVFSVYKYIDLKNREERRLDYQNLNNLINYVSGDEKMTVLNSKYIANIYQLSLFKEQSFIIVPFLTYLKEDPFRTNEKASSRINDAIDYVLKKLNAL